jgi:hypothetical protein
MRLDAAAASAMMGRSCETPPDESNVGAVKEGHGLAPASGMK